MDEYERQIKHNKMVKSIDEYKSMFETQLRESISTPALINPATEMGRTE